MNKRGFLFVVTIFLILTYILLSISVWVKGVEASERAYSEFYKESTVELSIEQITPAKMGNVTDKIMSRSLFRMNERAIDSPLRSEADIEAAMFEMLVNGTADSGHFKGTGIASEGNSSLSSWASGLNASLLAIGVYISEFEATNFSLGQKGIDTLNYSVDIRLQLRDFTNTSSVSRKYEIDNTLDITGLVDPALARETKDEGGDDNTAYRQFFFHDDYSDPSDIVVDQIAPGQGGQGWIYSYLATAGTASTNVPEWDTVSPSTRQSYVLVGTFDEIMATSYKAFAGYIVTSRTTTTPSSCGVAGALDEEDTFNPIRRRGTLCDEVDFDCNAGECTGKPFIVAPAFNASKASDCPYLLGTGERKCALLLNNYLPSEVSADHVKKLTTSGSGVYDVELMRDFVMCGYYTHNPEAPSYMQRLLDDPYSYNSTEYGIETFVIGEYAGDYSVYDMNSRLDRELLNSSISGIKIRGMPGCKSFDACSGTPDTGIFAMSPDAITDYGLDAIDCGSGAGCD